MVVDRKSDSFQMVFKQLSTDSLRFLDPPSLRQNVDGSIEIETVFESQALPDIQWKFGFVSCSKPRLLSKNNRVLLARPLFISYTYTFSSFLAADQAKMQIFQTEGRGETNEIFAARVKI